MFRKKKGLFIVFAVLVIIATGGFYYSTTLRAEAQASGEPTVQTSTVRTGELIISATGAGTVIPSIEVDMGVETGGLLVELNVQAGDQVLAGDVLARVDDLNYRKALASTELNLAKAELDLETARQDHEDLLEAVDETDILDAEATLTSAQEALEDLMEEATDAEIANAEAALAAAREAYDDLANGPDADELERAQLAVDKAKNSLWSSQMNRDAQGKNKDSSAYDQAQANMLNAEIAVRQAEMDLAELQEPATDAELEAAWAKVLEAEEALSDLLDGATAAEIATAEARIAQAQDALDDLIEGASDEDMATSAEKVRQAELSVAQAELSLEVAQNDLNGVTLVAPLDGTILDVSAEVGERVGDNVSFVTVADLNNPMLEVYVDESDMDKIAVGYDVEVVLDALPDDLFHGTVTQVDPQLVTESGVDVIRGLVALDADSFAKPESLPMGLNATVDIIGGRAENAVLVPVEALRDLGDGEYAVFVMENGEPTLRTVTVGLQDYTYAEVTEGLSAGETVSTGIVETY